jgi:hypothetical protein
MSKPTHTFVVRGRPVGFVPSHFGGELVALERGYFPVSSTGYRSLAGHFGISGEADPAAISAEFLESLAVAQDHSQRTLLARLRRAPLPTPNRLGNFIAVCIDAEAALAQGFFAPNEERVALWRGAVRLLNLNDTDARFQPVPTAPAWPAASCAHALAIRRALLGFVRQLAAGELPPPPDGTHFAVCAYFDLPPKPGGEPTFALPALTAELPLDLSPSEDFGDDDEEDDAESEHFAPSENDPAQLSLL